MKRYYKDELKKYNVNFSMGIYSEQMEVNAYSGSEAYEIALKKMDNSKIDGSDIQFEEDDIEVEEVDNA
tara:strand:+ start:778 stop:984 length:207 start_codon:yes stop_codon:yes gene_type:complete